MTSDDLVRLGFSCPLCKARPGEPCRTLSTPFRSLAFLHLERIQAYYRALR